LLRECERHGGFTHGGWTGEEDGLFGLQWEGVS
jgi:hypothetical protein